VLATVVGCICVGRSKSTFRRHHGALAAVSRHLGLTAVPTIQLWLTLWSPQCLRFRRYKTMSKGCLQGHDSHAYFTSPSRATHARCARRRTSSDYQQTRRRCCTCSRLQIAVPCAFAVLSARYSPIPIATADVHDSRNIECHCRMTLAGNTFPSDLYTARFAREEEKRNDPRMGARRQDFPCKCLDAISITTPSSIHGPMSSKPGPGSRTR
jgi:hypothetical protein